MGATFVSGDKELKLKLRKLRKDTAKTMRPAIRRALRPVVERAKVSIPVGDIEHKTYRGRIVAPGFSSRNIRIVIRADRKTGGLKGMVGVSAEAFYALQFVELGVPAYGVAAQPWLEPAFRSSQAAIISEMRRALREVHEKIARADV
jgi:HK97 gp10 family phage protein